MSDVPKSAVICFVIASFIFGFITGKNSSISINSKAEREIIELNIELTKLQIKKLKGWLMRDYIMKVIYDLIKPLSWGFLLPEFWI